MAKVEHTSDARVLVGIDISKHRHEVLIAVPGKTRRRRLTITNSTDDFVRLIAILREYGLPCVSACNFDPLRRGIGVQF
jgi:hypothetical protein